MSYQSWGETGIEGIRPNKLDTQVVICPKCSRERKKKNLKCMSVNLGEKWFKCNHCGYKGKVYDEEVRLPKIQKQEYSRPEFVNVTELSDGAVKWFTGRGITQMTLKRNRISNGEESVYDKGLNEWVKRNCIQFPYIRDGEPVNIKYRDAKKNFKLYKGAELILFGLDDIKDQAEIIITEGEVDKLSWDEAGIRNCASVPNGATLENNNLQYIDNCYEYFEKPTKIILALDNDAAGKVLTSDLAFRLGKERCWIVDYPDGCKDANDVLSKLGVDALRKCYDTCRQWPMEGVVTNEELIDEVSTFYVNGLPKGVSIQHKEFNDLLRWRRGELTLVTGIPGHGKSDFVDDICVGLAYMHGWKFGVFSPENYPPGLHVIKLIEKLFGLPFFSKSGRMDEDTLYKAVGFILEHFFFVKMKGVDVSVDGVLKIAKELVLRKGISGFISDPWNRYEHSISSGQSETNYISECLSKIYQFKEDYNIHFFQVAHPTKIKKDKEGLYEVPTLYDIAGSAHFYNKTDNGITVYRDSQDLTTVFVQKVKWKFMGRKGSVDFEYNLPTGQYRERNGAPGFMSHMKGVAQEPVQQKEIPLKPINHLPYRDDEDDDLPF